MLTEMAQAMAPQRTAARDRGREALAALHKRRDQLVEHRAAERARLSETADVHASVEGHLAWLSAEIARFDRLIAEAVAGDTAIADDVRLLRSAPGVGPVTAATLAALMPELGSISPRAAAAIAGLAPFDDQSGRYQGRRHISGGRRRVRRALYMAAVAATRSQSRFNGLYQSLRERGKPAKLALIAIARKLITILNAIMRDRKAFAQ